MLVCPAEFESAASRSGADLSSVLCRDSSAVSAELPSLFCTPCLIVKGALSSPVLPSLKICLLPKLAKLHVFINVNYGQPWNSAELSLRL